MFLRICNEIVDFIYLLYVIVLCCDDLRCYEIMTMP